MTATKKPSKDTAPKAKGKVLTLKSLEEYIVALETRLDARMERLEKAIRRVR